MKDKHGKIKIAVIVIGVLFWLIIGFFIIRAIMTEYDFTNSFYVITQEETTHLIHYYEINHEGRCRECEEFTADDMRILTYSNCTQDEADILTKMEEKINAVSEDNILDSKILTSNNQYFAIVELNVNLWSPYKLYYYDLTTEEFTLLYTFDGEDVIGISPINILNPSE